MTTKKLRVRAVDGACVSDFERLEAPINPANRFIGRVFKETSPGHYGFVPTDEVEEVPARAEYIKALRDGDLLPADEETARAAGLKFSLETIGGGGAGGEPASESDTRASTADAVPPQTSAGETSAAIGGE